MPGSLTERVDNGCIVQLPFADITMPDTLLINQIRSASRLMVRELGFYEQHAGGDRLFTFSGACAAGDFYSWRADRRATGAGIGAGQIERQPNVIAPADR